MCVCMYVCTTHIYAKTDYGISYRGLGSLVTSTSVERIYQIVVRIRVAVLLERLATVESRSLGFSVWHLP